MDLEDPHDYLGQELSTWDEWPQGTGSAKTQLRKQATDWLHHWIVKYKIPCNPKTGEDQQHGQDMTSSECCLTHLLAAPALYMAFPLPKVNLCLFTSFEDLAKPDPSFRLLGAELRYFFLEHSYADNYK
ncbi:UNVERIFIED_CONTAM: hypothetical protein FKN15_050890 [Acipenser sinensis]